MTKSETGKQNSNKDDSSDDKLNITDASKYLRISRDTTWRIITYHRLRTFENPLDMRGTLVSRDDLDRIKNLSRPKKHRRKAKRK